MVVRNPARIASTGLTPLSVASFAITSPPSAITMPMDRSMPAIRMMSVCPMARTAVYEICCRISEKLVPEKKRGDWVENTITAISSATSGPRVLRLGSCKRRGGGAVVAGAGWVILTSSG